MHHECTETLFFRDKERVEQIKLPATKPDDLSSTPRTDVVETELSYDFHPQDLIHGPSPACTYSINVKM